MYITRMYIHGAPLYYHQYWHGRADASLVYLRVHRMWSIAHSTSQTLLYYYGSIYNGIYCCYLFPLIHADVSRIDLIVCPCNLNCLRLAFSCSTGPESRFRQLIHLTITIWVCILRLYTSYHHISVWTTWFRARVYSIHVYIRRWRVALGCHFEWHIAQKVFPNSQFA